MASFFGSIVNFFTVIGEYLIGMFTSIIEYFGLITSSSLVFGQMVGFLPSIIQISGQAVVSIAIFKAIFGRQGLG